MRTASAKSILGTFFLVLLCIVGADQLTKHLVVSHLMLYQSIPVAKGWLNLVYVHNTGVAFGFFNGPNTLPKTLFFSGVTLIAVIVVLYFLSHAVQDRDRVQAVLLGMICGGAIGNLIDRFRLGSVIDFVDVHYKQYHWPAFNVADSAISVGVVLLILLLLFRKPREVGEGDRDASSPVSYR